MEKEIGKILIIDDDEDVLLAAKMLLKKHAHEVIIEKNPNKIPFLLNNDNYDVILLDMNFSQDTTSGKEGFHWLSQIKEKDPQAVVILITAFGDVEMAVKALKEANVNIKGMVAIFTYGFELASKNFKSENVTLYTLSDYEHLLEQALKTKYITAKEKAVLTEWNSNPSEWGTK